MSLCSILPMSLSTYVLISLCPNLAISLYPYLHMFQSSYVPFSLCPNFTISQFHYVPISQFFYVLISKSFYANTVALDNFNKCRSQKLPISLTADLPMTLFFYVHISRCSHGLLSQYPQIPATCSMSLVLCSFQVSCFIFPFHFPRKFLIHSQKDPIPTCLNNVSFQK